MQITTSVGVFLVCGLSSDLDHRRPPTSVAPIVRAQEKVAERWLSHVKWSLSLEQAKARSKQEGKLIFAYFKRGYAP